MVIIAGILHPPQVLGDSRMQQFSERGMMGYVEFTAPLCLPSGRQDLIDQAGVTGGGAEELMVRNQGRMTDECLPRKSGRYSADREKAPPTLSFSHSQPQVASFHLYGDFSSLSLSGRSIQTSHQQASSSITKLAYR